MSKGGRRLAGADTEESITALGRKVQSNVEALHDAVAAASKQDLGPKMRAFYEEVFRHVSKIYGDSLDMINKYGDFYVMTHRIWVATENIFRVFENRAFEVRSEMRMNHYEPIKLEKEKLWLSRAQFLSSAKVSELPSLTLATERPAVLICRAGAEVDNEDFSELDRDFELSLVLNNDASGSSSPFKYKVQTRKDRLGFITVLSLPPGRSELSLFARLGSGDIRLSKFAANCVKFTDYAHLPEYKDFRLT